MTFAAAEPLAIHTIAAAAYGILKDLKTENFATLLRAGILAIAKDYASGEIEVLPEHLRDNAEIAMLVICIADNIRRDGVAVATESFNVEASPDIERQFWEDRNYAANFLKHADRDSTEALDVRRLDTGTLIMTAIGAYLDLFPQITPEMEVFHVFNAAETGVRDGIRKRYQDILDMLQELDPNPRRAVCQAWLDKLKSKRDSGGGG